MSYRGENARINGVVFCLIGGLSAIYVPPCDTPVPVSNQQYPANGSQNSSPSTASERMSIWTSHSKEYFRSKMSKTKYCFPQIPPSAPMKRTRYTQCRPKGLQGPTTGGLNHLRNLKTQFMADRCKVCQRRRQICRRCSQCHRSRYSLVLWRRRNRNRSKL